MTSPYLFPPTDTVLVGPNRSRCNNSIGLEVCRNLPFGGRATRDSRDACSTKGIRAESPPTFIRGKRRKNRKRRDVRTFKLKGSRVVFTQGEGISTPHVHPKGRQPLIECANMTLIFTFPFMSLYPLYPFYIFPFLWSTRVFPFAPTYSSIYDEEIRPT